MSGTPMSNEQRAALEQRLAQLRAAQGTNTAGPAAPPTCAPTGPHSATQQPQQQQQQQQHYQQQQQQRGGYAASGARPAPQMGYGYDDDDDDEEEEEEEFDIGRQQFEEEFLRMLAVQQQQQQQQRQPQRASQSQLAVPQHERNAASVAQVNATRHADDGVDIVATDKTAQRSRELSDFEALRLAKMGDAASMLDFGTACGIDWKTFVDNHGRNALHYAADAGSAALIRKLSDDLRVPYVADEKKVTPLDVAILNGHGDAQTDEVVAALVAAASVTRHADARLGDPQNTKTLDSVLQAHAPAPPKFVMSKPVPKPAEATGVRTFWSAGSAAPAASSTVQCSSGGDVSVEEAAETTAAVSALDQHGRFEWVRPLTRTTQAPCGRWQVARTVDTSGGSSSTTGVVVAQVLDNATLAGSVARRVKTSGAVKVAIAAHLGVRGAARKSGVAAQLLHSLHTLISSAVSDAPEAVVFFAAGATLPRPPTPVATVKWYRRVFDAVSVYASDSAFDVFPDFYTYDAVLRADAVLKGALPQQLFDTYASAMQSWCTVDVASDEQCSLIQRFIAEKAGTAESNVDLACVPQDTAELRRSILDHPDHCAYAHTDANGAVTDLVVLRRRDARKHSDEGTFAAELVYALFTGITGTAKADHLMLIASKLLSAKMLLVPTLFGVTESDLAKSNFDELTASRESVYAVSSSTLRDVEGLGVVPASRLSLPLYSI